jgi:O-antigen/teichoic acid export membrane protein
MVLVPPTPFPDKIPGFRPFDEHGRFHIVAEHSGLRRVAVRGAGVTALFTTVGFAIQMIATVILARLLTPADFGLVAIVTTFTLLLMNVGYNGISEAVIQRDEFDHALASNLFWINAGIGLCLAVAFAAAGSLLARLYGDPRVAPVAIALSATIFLSSLSVLHLALLKRGMQFSTVSTNDVVARVASVAVSIACGWGAWGYWALVAGAITLPTATCAGAWVRCRWIPGRPRRRAGTGAMVRFAMNTFGHFSANYCTRNLDNLLVGWLFGPQSLGFYKKAYDFCVLPVAQLSDPLHAVAVPILSRLAGDPERHKRYVLRALSTLAFVGMGLGAGLALVGQDLIYVLLGPQWTESGRIFSFFAPAIGGLLLYVAYGWIHLSMGRPDRMFRWAVIEFAVIGCLFVLGLPWGPVGVASAWVVSAWVLAVPALWYAGRPVNLGIGSIIGAVWRYVVAAPLAGAMARTIIHRIPARVSATGLLGAIDRGLMAFLLFGALYLCAVIVLYGGPAPLRQVGALLRDMLPQPSHHPDVPPPLVTSG